MALSQEEEEERLAALHELGVEYGTPDPRFDSIVQLVKGIFQVRGSGMRSWAREYSRRLAPPGSAQSHRVVLPGEWKGGLGGTRAA